MAGASLKTIAAATLTAGGTAQKISGTTQGAALAIYVNCPAANSANIFIGDINVKASTSRGIEIVKGTTYTLEAQDGQLLNINGIYFDGTTNDKAGLSYLAPANG